MKRIGSSPARGVSFIELVIVLAALSVFLAGAHSWTINYLVRQKVSEALAEAEHAKRRILITCAEAPSNDALSSERVALNFASSPYVERIGVSGSCLAPSITIVTAKTGLRLQPVLTLSGHATNGIGQVSWTCTTDGLDVHVPAQCRST